MESDPVRDIVTRGFRVYDEREERIEGGLAARLFFIMGDATVFDAAFEQVRSELRALDEELIVFIRRQGGEDILFVTERPPAGGKNRNVAGVLLLLTFLTTAVQGALYWKGFNQPGTEWTFANMFQATNLLWGFLTFGLPLMAILIVHESAHYIAARRHGLRPSLPFFIPLPPVGYFGTMGAFIRMRDPLPDRKSLFDVGASGPIAGFVVAVPIIVVGALLTGSSAVPLPDAHEPVILLDGFDSEMTARDTMVFTMDPAEAGTYVLDVVSPKSGWSYTASLVVSVDEGQPLRDQFTVAVDEGQRDIRSLTIPDGAQMAELTMQWDDGLVSFGDPLIVKAINPLFGDGEHLTHPLFFAGWVGVFLTGLNLLPLGQLDGGHVSRAVFGDRSRQVAMFTLGGLMILSFWFQMWLVLGLLVFFFMGIDHPPPLNDRTPLDGRRKAAAVLVLALLALCFVPIPIIV